MMATKRRFAEAYATGFHSNFESDGSDSSARRDEITAYGDSIAPGQKWIDLNSTSLDGFYVPVQIVALSALSPSEKKSLVLRLKSELEKIRAFQKKFQMLRSNNVTMSSSTDILSCTNVQKGPQTLQSKKSSGLASKTGKKLSSSSNKARGWNRSTSGRFQSVNQGFVPNPNAAVMKLCENILKKLMSHQYGWVFKSPVDTVKLNIPDYHTVIKHPMDLGTVKRKLTSGEYPSPLEFSADVRLTFSNAKTYNPPGNDVHIMADTMSKFFEVRWKDVQKKLPAQYMPSLPEKSGFHEEMEVVKATAPAKKRKLSPALPAAMLEAVKPRITDEDKRKLRNELESLEDLPDKVNDFLRVQFSNAAESEEDEIEIDMDDLDDDALFTLRKLLDEHLLEKQKLAAKAEPCEIELPNESGLSSSSMQVDKGIDLVDEDIDIGGNEPPVSSYRAVEIESDTGLRANRSDRKSDLSVCNPSDGEVETEPLTTAERTLDEDDVGAARGLLEKENAEDLAEGNQSVSGLDQLEQSSQEKPNSDELESQLDGESAPAERQLSPEKRYRAAILKNRFADTILKAREKTLGQGDPEKLRREIEELELQKKRERARLQAEAKAAEHARRRAEEEAASEVRRKREVEREAARQALLKIEQTVEINENSRFLEDLEMLRAGPQEQLASSVEDSSPDELQEGFGIFKFGANNPLEQFGLYMKEDEEDEGEEGEPEDNPPPPPPPSVNDDDDNDNDDVEEGEID